MSGQPSFRTRQQNNRTPIWIALAVTAILFAIMLGWFANSIFRESKETAGVDTQTSSDTQHRSKNAASEKDELNSTKNTTSSITRTSRSELAEDSRTKPSLENSHNDKTTSENSIGENRNSELNSDSGSSSSTATQQGPPRLADLPSYKNSKGDKPPKPPRKSRAESPTKKANPRRDSPAKSTDAKGLIPDAKTDKPKLDKRDGQDNQFVLPQTRSDIKLYQQLVVDRNPTFSMEGLSEFKQVFKFRAVSEITIKPADKNGFRKVIQKVTAAKLLSADSISKKSLEESISKLPGKEFSYTLDRKQRLFDFKGEKDNPKTLELKDLTSISGFTGEGMMMSSVMDLDGWREMAQLTFLLPDDKKKKWKDQMGHDWGDLGKWIGETRFEKKAKTNGLLQIDYAHYMTYKPKFGDSKLPFKIDSMAFNSTEAGGRLFFDEKNKRIKSLTERFKVTGELAASLLGSSINIKMSEEQTFQLSLHAQNPQ